MVIDWMGKYPYRYPMIDETALPNCHSKTMKTLNEIMCNDTHCKDCGFKEPKQLNRRK